MNDPGSLSEPRPSSESDEVDSPSLDGLFGVLADSRRRHLLCELAERKRSMTLSELAEAVATREHDCPATDVHESSIDRIRITLYHSHVPKLADAGVIEYAPADRTVSLAVDPDVVKQHLDDESADDARL